MLSVLQPLISSTAPSPAISTKMERDRRLLGINQTLPCRQAAFVTEPLVHRVQHHKHRLDSRIMTPRVQIPRLVLDPRR